MPETDSFDDILGKIDNVCFKFLSAVWKVKQELFRLGLICLGSDNVKSTILLNISVPSSQGGVESVSNW